MRSLENRKPEKHSNPPFFEPKIQKKIKTGTAGDQFEVQADRVADKVVNNNSSTGGLLQSKEEVQQKTVSESINSVQAKDIKEEKETVQKKDKEEEPLQKKEEEKDQAVQKKDKEEEKPVQKKEEENETVQKKEQNAESDSKNDELEEKLNNSKNGGQHLDKKTKNEMEAKFGNDFSNVKIHTGSNAVQMSEQLGAQAFTTGNNVFFNKGKYNPGAKEGKHLLAHELTHTIQQTGMVQKSPIENNSQKPSPENHQNTQLNDEVVELKGSKKETDNNDTVAFVKGPFTSQESVGFFSTAQSSTVDVTIEVTAQIVESHFCSTMEISIDHVNRTKRSIAMDSNGKGRFSESFTMKNHKDIHHLFFNMPKDCKGMGETFMVKGTIKRHQ